MRVTVIQNGLRPSTKLTLIFDVISPVHTCSFTVFETTLETSQWPSITEFYAY